MKCILVLLIFSCAFLMPAVSQAIGEPVLAFSFDDVEGEVYNSYRDLNKNGQMDPYENPNLAVEDRVDDLLSRMTIDEKVGQMIHDTFDPNPSDGMPPAHTKTWLQRYNQGFLLTRYSPGPGAAARCSNQLQEWAEGSRLGIPVIISMDSVHGLSYVKGATIWPYGLGLAAARNVELVRKLGEVLAKESRATGIHESLGPVADVGTDPRWGRVMETCGEDADLATEIIRAQVEAMQGKALSENSVLCTTKHFPGAGPERDGVDAFSFIGGFQSNKSTIVSTEDTLEYHLRPFRAAIEAGTGAIMPYYSPVELIDDIPALGSHGVLVELLRNDLGYDGIICTDWSPALVMGQRKGYNANEALKMVINADADVLGGESIGRIGSIVRMVDNGDITEDEINNSVRRILRVKFQLGLFDDPYVEPEYAEEIVGCEEHQRLSLQAARESMTLLKNDGILPLSETLNILVAGPRAGDIASLAGGWTGYPQPGMSILNAVKSRVSGDAQVSYGSAAKAEELAEQADVAIVAVGEGSYIHTSPWGPGRLSLEDRQLDLIKAIHSTGTPTVVVLIMGRPYIIPWCAENVHAIVAAYHPGTRGGEAIADVLFGDHNPSGKLPFQMPRSMEQVEAQREDVPFDIEDPLYSYGYGLSYDAGLAVQPQGKKIDKWGGIKRNRLLQNYPNPSNPETWIPFQLAQDADVTVDIYNTKGRLARSLHLGDRKAGIYITEDKAAHWDGMDNSGEKVASGTYFYILKAGTFRATRKMIILR